METLYPPTGRYDDLLMLLARSEERRLCGRIPVKSPASRLFLEPLFNLLGLSVAAALRMMPHNTAARVQDGVFRGLIGKNPTCPFDADSENLKRTRELMGEAEKISGNSPALFCLTSHPPAFGELLYLNVELMRHALRVLRELRGKTGRPRLVIGMDYFALDMLALYEEGAYAGFTGSYHLGFDRLSHLRRGLGGALLGATAWPNVAKRLLERFLNGGDIGMVLGGGVPETSRLFYCAREFVGRLYKERPDRVSPEEIRRRLCEACEDFKKFLSEDVGGLLRNKILRSVQAWVISALIGDDGAQDAQRGTVGLKGREALQACIRSLGYEGAAADSVYEEFEREFARENPYRERLFALLARRVAARGRPIVILPLTYGRPGAVRMRFGAPVSLMGTAGAGALKIKRPGEAPEEVATRTFCREFVTREYP